MQDFVNKKILLGICGGVAAYKSAYLIRELTRLGAEVRAVMTQSAMEFISPLLIQALSGSEVRTSLFDTQAERAMGHIELARWADYLVIAPASANTIAKMAQGLGDDLLSTLYLVSEAPVIICPAMNKSMWAHPATVANCALLQERGVIFVGPEEGIAACGEFGLGRLSDELSIINTLRLLEVHSLLAGREVLIMAGPTREPIDPVRFISNRSSGKMGYAMAAAALMAGARVTLVSGHTSLQVPFGVNLINVDTAKDMHEAVMKHLKNGSIFIATAAVADYRVEACSTEKIKKQKQKELSITLVSNPDILAEVAASGLASYVVGFAAETTDVILHATEKLHRKKCDMIIANQVGSGLGFDTDVHEVTVITKDKQIPLPHNHKTRLAGQIIAMIATGL
jgi:phosphopantothenoylcysteine decarboxylase / phosphopantothenate---cysteine ligase